MNEQKKFVDNLNSRSSFKFGLLSGLGIMFAIGFFITLGLLVNAKSDGNIFAKTTGNNGVKQPMVTDPTPTDAGGINIQPVSKDDWVRGDRQAPISIIEFSDTECPFCKRFHDTMNQVVSEYDGQVNWIYRHFPLTSLHSKAPREAEALECAGDQAGNDGFWAYADRLFEVTPSNNGLAESQLTTIAEGIGLNVNKFQECLDSGKFTQKVQDQANQATAAGGRGTPYSIIVSGDKKIPINGALPFEQIKATLDGLIN